MPPTNLSPTVPPKEETRSVVIEPPRPPQPRRKQYVTLHGGEYDKHKAGQFELVWLTEEVARSAISARQIIPLDVAIREGVYPPKIATSKNKVTEAVTKVAEEITGLDLDKSETVITEVESSPTAKKSFLGNKLRTAVQAKKTEPATTNAKIDPQKLAAIKAGGNN